MGFFIDPTWKSSCRQKVPAIERYWGVNGTLGDSNTDSGVNGT